MARESLFDSRYRYDHIYPRGRSGEALRAFDTHENDRPVVIKRPAPQDAPPIRAGQEVSIRTERRVLVQLDGHPALTKLYGEGTFRVGGQSHLYIVMERAGGEVLEDLVRELASSDLRMPELEVLGIFDRLLDLLEAAHKHDIVYNDVDAKHLFWDRESYQLKVIDWGNAVFLEGDEVTPQGISRSSDIYQVGELLYFIVTGGQRLGLNGESVDFGEDATRIPTRIQSIIQRATHPVLDRRYRSISDLRADLAEYCRPLERDRAAILERLERRLESKRSQRELENILQTVISVQERDSGHPETRQLRARIEHELQRLVVLSDLDAARIYLESANWDRAIGLLKEAVPKAAGAEQARAAILFEIASRVAASGLKQAPAGVPAAIEALFDGDAVKAAYELQVTPEPDETARKLQWLLAQQVQVQSPGVLVLHPHLVRLQQDLPEIVRRYDALKPTSVIEESLSALEVPTPAVVADVEARYRRVAEGLHGLAEQLEAAGSSAENADPELAEMQSYCEQAGDTALAVAERLQVATSKATAAKPEALAALDEAISFDPINSALAEIRGTMEALHSTLAHLAEYRPQADGADIAEWLGQSVKQIKKFAEVIPDPRLPGLLKGIEDARQGWDGFAQAAIVGNRLGAADSLQHAADAIRRVNPDFAAWLSNVHGVVQKARFVHRHALNASFGRLMADGWAAWDRGSGIEAERIGRQALEGVTNDAERAAADRLIRLGKLLRSWKEGHGEGDPELTTHTDAQLVALLTPSEERHWRVFTERMSSAPEYLEAMGTQLVEHFERTSTAAQRILFFHYILRGVLDMYELRPDDAEFWRAAAERSLGDAERHVAYLALKNVMRDRQSIAAIVEQINAVETVAEVVKARRKVEASSFHLVLKPLADMLRNVEEALPLWEAGEFREAGAAFETGLAQLNEGERVAHVQLMRFRSWLERLDQVAAELHVAFRRIQEGAQSLPNSPEPRLLEWHQKLLQDTGLFLGEAYTAGFSDWLSTYEGMIDIYTDGTKRRSRKLHDFEELLKRPGIEKHPAFSLYKSMLADVETRPEFPAPPTDEPVPQFTEAEPAAVSYKPVTMANFEDAGDEPSPGRRGGMRWLLWGGGLIIVVVLVVVGLASLADQPDAGQIQVTWETETPTIEPTVRIVIATTAAPIETATLEVPSETPVASDTAQPTATQTALPSDTPMPTLASGGDLNTAVPTATPLPSPTRAAVTEAGPVPTLAGPLRGTQNVILALEQYAQAYPWPEAWFGPGELSGGWLLGVRDTGVQTGVMQVVMPADLLEQIFGTDAAVRLRRLDVTLRLRDYDPELVADGEVFFGLGLQGTDESRVALQVQMAREDAINVGARVGDAFRARSQYPIGDGRVMLSIVRYDDGTVGLLFNGEAVGSPRFLTAPNAPVMPFLFVQQSGVVVSVTDFVAELD